jgi:hypothetical protein
MIRAEMGQLCHSFQWLIFIFSGFRVSRAQQMR